MLNEDKTFEAKADDKSLSPSPSWLGLLTCKN